MHVRKRNGTLEPVNLNKIVASVERCCDGLPNVDAYRIATKTVGGLVDGVSTRELDLLSVRTAKDLIIEDPIYSRVAARILSQGIHKEVGGQDVHSFSQSIELGYKEGLISETTHDLVMANRRKLNAAVKHERDWLFEYHGLQTVYDRYLLKHPTATIDGSKQRMVIETPQYFFLRVACGLAENAGEAIEFYNLLSSLEYMTSTPTLFNSGTTKSQLASCFLLDSPLDSLDDLYKRYADIAMLSKFAGGIGVSQSRIRGRGALIKGTNGKSNGLVPWAHTLSGSVAAVNQCLHPDTLVYTEQGMKPIRQIIAGSDRVLGSTGHYRIVEEVLRYPASEERSIALTVRHDGLPIVVTDGHPIYAITGAPLSTDVRGDLEKGKIRPSWVEAGLLQVGDFVATPVPKLRSVEGFSDADTLVHEGMVWSRIKKVEEAETANEVYDLHVDFDETYTVQGALVHNGGKRKGAACIYLETHHPDIMQFLELRDNTGEREQRAYNLNLANWVSDLFMKRVKNDEMWSLFDATIAPELNDLYGAAYETRYIELESEGKYTEQLPARKVYARMMRTLAETGNGWMCFKDTINRRGNQVNDEAATMVHLSNLCSEIVEVTSSGKRDYLPREQIVSLSASDMIEQNIRVVGFDTKRDMFEVIRGSECAVCTLGSINIGRGYIKNGKLDKEKLRRNVAIAVKYLDRAINRSFYPVHEAEASNMRWRPVGLGLMGLADFFFQMRLPFESNEAIRLSAEIQEEIYYQALKTSCELAKQYGPHRDFHLTRAAKGDLQFDLAGVEPSDPERWAALKQDIAQHGLRNSLLIAIAPTATISHICGVEEAIEPVKSNLLKRETLSGEFIAINKYLVEDLRALGRWTPDIIARIKADEGSIANIPDLPQDLYQLYKTVWEMSMKPLIAHAVARGSYIDQSHSLNLFIDLNKYPEERRIGILSSLYMYAWESGLKTTYYFRSRAASRIEKTTVRDANLAPVHVLSSPMAPETVEVCESCT
jgi:ribonucleoside-diphosphate reductase alpha subunit